MTSLRSLLPLALILTLSGCQEFLGETRYVQSEWNDFTKDVPGFENSAQNVIGRSLYSRSVSWTDYTFAEVNEIELSQEYFLTICADKPPLNSVIISEALSVASKLKNWEEFESSLQLQSGCLDASGDLLVDRESERKIRILTPDAFIIVAYTI
jgi:hypothetical protein